MKQIEKNVAGNPMYDSLAGIEWLETTQMLNNLITSGTKLTFSPLSPGLEADVVKISQGEEHFVLKKWNKGSKPDVLRQYYLLEALHCHGICVSEPIGYGQTETGEVVLLTRYHGTAVTKVSPSIFKKIASILADVHQLPPDGLGSRAIAKHDFVGYFFSGIEAFPAMKEELTRLIASADMRTDRMIHGDFHLGNVLEENGQYTVIDWTNAQLGDPRFDLSLTCLFLRIYLSDSKSLTFLHKYQERMPVATEELEIFEAIACIRWLLLDRTTGVPKRADTMKKVRNIVRNNQYLHESVLL